MRGRKIRTSLVLLLLASMLIPVKAFAQDMSPIIDTSLLDSGIVVINYSAQSQKSVAVKIVKGDLSYSYSLVDGGRYPLQAGNGTYNIMVAEAADNNKYKLLAQKEVTLNLKDDTVIYLQSTEMVDWEKEEQVIKKAKALTKDSKTDLEKLKAIYNYMIKNYSYDYDKAKTVKSGYIPDLEQVMKSKKGICDDYATLTAAMLRSVGVSTKLVTGYQTENKSVYHAWNQVYLSDKEKWVTIDTTYDSILTQAGKKVTLTKSESKYNITKSY